MTLDDYQRAALRTRNPGLSPRDVLLDAVAGLAEESGELLGLVRKLSFQNRDPGADRLREELGDVLWCVASAADALGVGLDALAEQNLAKLRARHPDGFTARAE
jgi:NTP pyrophosphatase (non-canonical NTP hydrolase)